MIVYLNIFCFQFFNKIKLINIQYTHSFIYYSNRIIPLFYYLTMIQNNNNYNDSDDDSYGSDNDSDSDNDNDGLDNNIDDNIDDKLDNNNLNNNNIDAEH